MATKTVSPRLMTTINVTFGALIYSGLFRGIPLPGTPGGPKRQLTIAHNSIFGGDIKIAVRLARHGSYAVSAPVWVLEAWSLCEPKLEHPLPLPKDADRLCVGSILDDGCVREVVDKILTMSKAERISMLDSILVDSGVDRVEREQFERYMHHCISTAYAVESIDKAIRSSMGRPEQ